MGTWDKGPSIEVEWIGSDGTEQDCLQDGDQEIIVGEATVTVLNIISKNLEENSLCVLICVSTYIFILPVIIKLWK